MRDDAIVVTGVGVVSALGSDRDAVWRAFAASDGGVRVLADDDERRERNVDPNSLPDAGRAGWVRGFRPREQIRSPQLRRMDWCSRMLVAAARQAFDQAGLLPLDGATADGAAIVAGSCFGNQRETATYLERVFTAGLGAGQPFLFPNLVLNAAAGYAAIELGAHGPNLSVAEHEASGEVAIATALDLLRSGACTAVCAGGMDEFGEVYLEALIERRLLHPESYPSARRERALAARRGLRGGIVPGEGAATLLLETAANAARRGARVLAEIESAEIGGTAAGPYEIAADAGAAAERLLEVAAANATGGATGDGIGAVFGCADGTEARAALDANVLRAVAARQDAPPDYVPFRRLTGDFGAAGALGVALAALVLEAGVLPRAACDPAHGTDSRPPAGPPRRILVAGFGRSGVVAPVVLRATPRAD